MTNVALIAIAKDEDTYIHEWIHHHLYMGFSPIYIGVNRTSDKTLEIINKISKSEKEVYAFCLDWIDQSRIGLNPHIQNIGYSYLSSKIDKNLIDFVGFFDIDEFWFNVDGKTIQNFINENKPFDIASFFWLKQLGENTEFSPPFIDVKYDLNSHVKSIVDTSLLEKVDVFTLHVPSFKASFYNTLSHIDQFGNNISSLNANKIYNKQIPIIDNTSISNCILHRMMRSEREYLSLVLRGRPTGDLIKSNGRKGFKKANTTLPSVFDKAYYTSFNNFIMSHGLTEILKERRNAKLRYFKDKIESMNTNQLIREMSNAQDALNNTNGLMLFVEAFVQKVKNADLLRDFALKLENLDILLSYQLMQKAHKLRPWGPFIKNKCDEYQNKLQLNNH